MRTNRFTLLNGLLAAALAALVLTSVTASGARAEVDLNSELRCLALNIYHEARSEPSIGRRAVGHVVVNRASDPRFPDTLCAVIQQGGSRKLHRCQFSWWCDGRSDQPTNLDAWKKSEALARRIFWGRSPDPTAGALWYHTKRVQPVWRKRLTRGPVIGSHIFYVKDSRASAL